TTPCLPARRVASIQAAMPCSHGQRSSSVSGSPLCIFSMFEGGWNQSPSSSIQCMRCASIAAIVLLPEPETPVTTTTEGSSSGAADCIGVLQPSGAVDKPHQIALRARPARRQVLAGKHTQKDIALVFAG